MTEATPTLRETLIRDAEVYCARHNISLARLSTLVVNDGKFFDRIMNHGDCKTGTYESFRLVFDEDLEPGAIRQALKPAAEAA